MTVIIELCLTIPEYVKFKKLADDYQIKYDLDELLDHSESEQFLVRITSPITNKFPFNELMYNL